MKRLLDKTTKPFMIWVLAILFISVPVYYYVVDTIWLAELDEHNMIIAEKTAYELNRMNMRPDELEQSIALWNEIQPGTNIERINASASVSDSVYTVDRQRDFSYDKTTDRFRCLRKKILINNVPFIFTATTNVEESQETIAVIAVTTLFFFILIVIGLVLLTRRMSRTIWLPFRDTLVKLKTFNLSQQTGLDFMRSDTLEFEELNSSLSRLIDHSVSVYQAQKEFAENASHELQTPLAIIKNKVDTLLQHKDLTESQYIIAEEINKALTRSSRINRNLLLLARIENRQFANNEAVNMSELIEQNVSMLQELIGQNRLSVSLQLSQDLVLQGSGHLIEIMISNVLINAIRYSPAASDIFVILDPSGLVISNPGTQPLSASALFRRFARSTEETGGTGLGLAIVNEIAQYHNWGIQYQFDNGRHFFTFLF